MLIEINPFGMKKDNLSGVSLAWLLLSVQMALLPLLHALHGHSLTDHHIALGAQKNANKKRATPGGKAETSCKSLLLTSMFGDPIQC